MAVKNTFDNMGKPSSMANGFQTIIDQKGLSKSRNFDRDLGVRWGDEDLFDKANETFYPNYRNEGKPFL